MRKFLLAIPLVATFLLGGCATTGTPDLIAQVRALATQICGFLPTVATVGDIILAGNPAFVTATGIANAICAAVAGLPPASAARRAAPPPTVAGVVIHGRFVR